MPPFAEPQGNMKGNEVGGPSVSVTTVIPVSTVGFPIDGGPDRIHRGCGISPANVSQSVGRAFRRGISLSNAIAGGPGGIWPMDDTDGVHDHPNAAAPLAVRFLGLRPGYDATAPCDFGAPKEWPRLE